MSVDGERLDKIAEKIFDFDRSLKDTKVNVRKLAYANRYKLMAWYIAAVLLTLVNLTLLIIKFSG